MSDETPSAAPAPARLPIYAKRPAPRQATPPQWKGAPIKPGGARHTLRPVVKTEPEA